MKRGIQLYILMFALTSCDECFDTPLNYDEPGEEEQEDAKGPCPGSHQAT